VPPGPGVASGVTKAIKDSPTPHHRGRWYEDVGKGDLAPFGLSAAIASAPMKAT
jgi:hypothetical protein